MAGQYRRQLGRNQPVRIELFERFAHGFVQRAAVGFHQGLVGGLLDEYMPEGVFQFRMHRRQVDEAAGFEDA